MLPHTFTFRDHCFWSARWRLAAGLGDALPSGAPYGGEMSLLLAGGACDLHQQTMTVTLLAEY